MLIYYQQLESGGVKRCQHATTEGHSEDSHPDARGLPPAHSTGPGNAHTYPPLELDAQAVNHHGNFLPLVRPFQAALPLWLFHLLALVKPKELAVPQ